MAILPVVVPVASDAPRNDKSPAQARGSTGGPDQPDLMLNSSPALASALLRDFGWSDERTDDRRSWAGTD
ncbi:hypothetical protein CCO02nite_29090 [Cellulomonas composti]|uniref:Uncharacterized protein n=1 Tax=Cellulomonas composti TaxID=266130 RepID=A0A511JE37_9CELL|nr:hypothetical protein CCO02nite_29090 [Cellulomonas composti]